MHAKIIVLFSLWFWGWTMTQICFCIVSHNWTLSLIKTTQYRTGKVGDYTGHEMILKASLHRSLTICHSGSHTETERLSHVISRLINRKYMRVLKRMF